MTRGHGWVLLLCLVGRPTWADGPTGPEHPTSPAVGLWQQGQQAMIDGQADRAIGLYRQSLELDPGLVRNHLSLAAAFIARGEDDRAAPHLGRYVEAQPDHLVIRAVTCASCSCGCAGRARPAPSSSASWPTSRTATTWPASTSSTATAGSWRSPGGGGRVRRAPPPRHRPVPSRPGAGTAAGPRRRVVGRGAALPGRRRADAGPRAAR